MPAPNATKAATALANSDLRECDLLGGTICSSNSQPEAKTQANSKWRQQYRVHPAADVFPMMSDKELAVLGEDLIKNGLREPIKLMLTGRPQPYPGIKGATTQPEMLIDGRNRMEAMERAGFNLDGCGVKYEYVNGSPSKPRLNFDATAYIISLNIHRRHLTKQQQADLIVAAHRASRQLGEVPPKRHIEGKAGSEKDAEKFAIVADAEKHGISKRTVERSISARERADRAAYEEKHPEVKQERLEREARVKRFIEARQAKDDKRQLQKHDHQVKDFLEAEKTFEAALVVATKSISKFAPEAISFAMQRLNKIAARMDEFRDIAKNRGVRLPADDEQKPCAACDGNHGKGCPHCKPENYGLPPKKAGGGRDGPNLSADITASVPPSAKARS